MRIRTFSRRDLIKGSAAIAGSAIVAPRLMAAAPETSTDTPALLEAARKEGKVAFYTAIDLQTSEKIGKAFEAKYPGVACRVERNGAERLFQRIGQEQGSGIFAADVVCSTDTSHFLNWKRNNLLAGFLPEEVARHSRPSTSRPTAPTPPCAPGCA